MNSDEFNRLMNEMDREQVRSLFRKYRNHFKNYVKHQNILCIFDANTKNDMIDHILSQEPLLTRKPAEKYIML